MELFLPSIFVLGGCVEELELTQYNAVTGNLRQTILIDKVKEWDIEGNILYVLQYNGKRSVYVLSAGDSVEGVHIE